MMAATPALARRSSRSADRRFVLLGLALIVLSWEALANSPTGPFVLAAPSQVMLEIFENRMLLARALAVTLANGAAGFVLGNLAAIVLAGIALIGPRSQAVITGLALTVFCLPLVATGPILRVLFGPGAWPQIVLAALAVYYTTLVLLLVGLKATPSAWIDLIRSYGRGGFATLVHVRTIASLPYLFAGFQIAAPAAFLGAMVGEFTGAERGMGVLTLRAMRDLDVGMTWALATVATAVAIAAYLAIGWIARRVLMDDPPLIISPLRSVGRRRSSGWRVLASVVIVAGAAVMVWWVALELSGLDPFFAKRPDDVFRALFLAGDASSTRNTLAIALWETAVLLVPGYLAGLLAGAGLAIVVVLFPVVLGAAMPVAIALRSVPIVTTAPLIVLILGRGAIGTIVLVALMVFFSTFVACLHGLRQTPGQVLDVMDSYAASPFQRLLRARVPAMLPAFFASARMAVPASVLAVTVIEWLATGNGVGSLMALSASLSDYNMLWSAVVLVCALSVLGYGGIELIEARILRVYAPEQLA